MNAAKEEEMISKEEQEDCWRRTNDFEKKIFKLMINSIYRKTMGNLRKRINVRLVNNEKDFWKYTSRPTLLIKLLVMIMLLFMKLNQS